MSSIEPPGGYRLAIVIPAYRAEFLGAALASLQAQTSRRFHVYVGDDASPQALEPICGAYRAAGLPLTYHRFAENLGGGPDLVAQWNRCVRLSRGEEWVWLFSDDDIVAPLCVDRFWAEVARIGPEVNVLRFDSATLDWAGRVTALHPPHPPKESVECYAYHRLTLRRNSFAPDHIFRRAAFDRQNGFVAFPFALGSDDASWISFAEPGPLVTIPGAMVYWRQSGSNVSTLTGSPHAVEKLLALADCSLWFQQHFVGCRALLPLDAPPVAIDLPELARAWFLHQLVHLPLLSGAETWRLAGELQRRIPPDRRLFWLLRLLRRQAVRAGQHLVGWLSARLRSSLPERVSHDRLL